ncbi:MAG: 8-amino-7-oxononanoate synthase [Betaproteobacteria bacterium]|nr:8-amino-7-oxononanoate synthase [Betaproteobacteria bacterium]
MPAQDFSAELARLDAAGLRRVRRTLDGAQAPRASADGRQVLSFCSNDYLGLAAHPRLAAAVAEAAARHGVGAGASHLVSGHHALHGELEAQLSEWMDRPCLLFSGGYMANTGVLPALAGREDAIFADRLVHASLVDGALLSRAALRRFRHNDVAHLRQLLEATLARRRLIVVDGVFSMDGDLAPLPALLRLAEEFDALLYVDDAHGFGVLGGQGRGTLEHFGVASARIVHLCTFGKAAGSAGAAVFAEASVIEWLMNTARTYIYTTALPPLVAAATLAALQVMAEEPWRRDRLVTLAKRLRQGCAGLPWRLMPSDTAIQPLRVGSNEAAMALAARLWEQGIWVPAIRPPTVPEGSARLRISLSAAHAEGDVDRLVAALVRAAEGAA